MRFIDPVRAASHFHLREGDVVADFGAGSGFFEPVLSRAVGAEGKVYALEIQQNLVERLEALARDEELINVEVRRCDLEEVGGCALPEGGLDAIVCANVLFQFEDRAAALAEAARLMRPGGKLFILDWSDSFGSMGPCPEDVLTEEAAKAAVLAAGFSFTRSFPAGEHHYGLAFRRE